MEEDEIDLAFACFTAALTLLAFGVLVWLLTGCSKPAAAGSTSTQSPVPTSEYSVETRPLSVVPTAYPAPSPTPAPTLPDGRPESAVDDLMVNAEPATPAPVSASVVTEAKGEPPMEGVRTKGVAAVTTTVAIVKSTPAPALVALPQVPDVPGAALDLMVDGETGGEAEYMRDPHPEWPEGDSGVTIAIGYDLSTYSQAIIRSDWNAYIVDSNLARLVATQPYHGTAAKAKAAAVHDITIGWQDSLDVFENVDVVRTLQLTERTYPGVDDLDPVAKFVLVDLLYNRGSSLVGSSRTEMRAIKDLVPKKDYKGMAAQLRHMERVWAGTSIYRGMVDRREAEAKLMESCAP